MKWLIVASIVVFLSSCLSPPDAIKKERAIFEAQVANNPTIQRHMLEVGKDRLFYAAAGDPQKPALIIVHGTPGNWHQYARYMLNEALLEDFYIAVVDRPGWGASQLGGNEKNASFKEQAAILSALAKRFKAASAGQPVILMGHSLGASISPRVALDYPEAIDGLLLLAGTHDPALSKPRWFNRIAGIPGGYWFLSDNMEKANKEIFALRKNIEAMQPIWQQLQAYTTVVQGMKDELVYPANIDYAEKTLNPEISEMIRLPNEGHLFPMTRRNDVVSWSKCLLKKINTQNNQC